MKKIIVTFLALIITSFSCANAGEAVAKELSKTVEEGPYVETAQKGIRLSGYIDAGYQYNFLTSERADFMKKDLNSLGVGFKPSTDSETRGEFGLNAVKLALEKPLTDTNELQAGFRVDLMFGQDVKSLGATDAAAGEDRSDSLFVEQAYVQFRLPYGNGIDFKVGKFVSLLGYELIERPANINISYGNLFTNMGPRTHIGVLSSYKFNDTVDAKFGVVEGWGNGYSGIFDNNISVSSNSQVLDGAGLTGSINITAPGGNANIQNAFYYGINNQVNILNDNNGSPDNGDIFVWDMWGNWVPKFANDKLLLGFNASFGVANTEITSNSAGDLYYTHSNWGGAAVYAKYQFTDIFSLAGRADYIHNDDSNKFGNDANLSNEDIYSCTLTASFDIIENMMLRTEYRADFGDNIIGDNSLEPLDPHNVAHQATVQVVYSF